MENLWIVGDPEQYADKIRTLYETVGGFGTLLSVTADSDDPRLGSREPAATRRRGCAANCRFGLKGKIAI